MGRIAEGVARKGSQKWLQETVNNNQKLLNSLLKSQLRIPRSESIAWLSPLASDNYAEYQDQAFLNLLKIKLPEVSLHEFWPASFYQYTNRLDHLYLLRVLNDLPAYLVFVCFVNDTEMNGPKSKEVWQGALKLLHSYLGIGRHKLSKYIADVFIELKGK